MAMKTKVIALDVYGTILSSIDFENVMPVRRGFERFVSNCLNNDIYLVTISDAPLTSLKLDLTTAFNKTTTLNLSIFDDFYELKTYPKDISIILPVYNIKPNQLFVIGDQEDRDLKYAKSLCCSTYLVPEYTSQDKFDFSTVKIP